MKKLVWVAVISLVTVYNLAAQVRPTEKQAVEKVIVDLFQALADRDAGQLKTTCASGFMLLEDGVIWNVDSLTRRIDQNKAIKDFKRINTIDFIDTKVTNSMAWATYSNQAEVTKNGQRGLTKWLETAVLIKEGKAWKISVLHSTLLKRSRMEKN